MRVVLEKSDTGGWRVRYGPSVRFVGTRPGAKRAAAELCREKGERAWWHQKKGGKWVEVPVSP